MTLRQRELALVQRREQLLARSGQLRQRLAGQSTGLVTLLTWADRGQAAWHWLRANPLPVLGGALALALWRPRRALHWAWRAWGAWRWWQKVSAGRKG